MTAAPLTHPDALAQSEMADIETSSAGYARRFQGQVGAWFLRVQAEAMLALLRPHAGAHVLDVGGGHAQLTGPLLASGYTVTVLGSREACGARLAPWRGHPRFAFEVGNVVALPYPDRSFDVALSVRLLAHVGQWQRLLAELARVARHAVIVDFASARSINAVAPSLFRWKQRLEGDTRPFACFQEEVLLTEFARQGFHRAARCPQFLLPMVLHRALRAPRFSVAAERLCRALGATEQWGSPVILKVARVGATRPPP